MKDEESPSIIEPPKNEITIKCAELTDAERAELEHLLESQPTVREVRRRMFARDHGPDGGIGLMTHIPWELVVVLADSVKQAAPVLIPLITAFVAARHKRLEAQKKHEDGTTERAVLYDDVGRTVKIFRKPKR